MESLTNLRLLAQGGQALIYEYGEGRVLRVLRNPDDAELLQYEIAITKALLGSDVSVPEVYESLTVDGKPAVAVQRIPGISMLAYMKAHPLKLKTLAHTLAELHIAVSAAHVPGLKPARGRARVLTDKSAVLSLEDKAFVQQLIEALPDGEALCHGDFHPGNILMHDGKHYIIDWFGAYQGDMLSDAAHTYLILKNVPRFPGVSALAHVVMKLSGVMLAHAYLRSLRGLTDVDMGQFSRWLAVKAAERSFYGMPAEKPLLVRFIEKCRQHQSEPASWYTFM